MEERIFGPLEVRDSSSSRIAPRLIASQVMYTDKNGHLAKDVMDVSRPGQKYPGTEFGFFSTGRTCGTSVG
jgi:hypothetical protein